MKRPVSFPCLLSGLILALTLSACATRPPEGMRSTRSSANLGANLSAARLPGGSILVVSAQSDEPIDQNGVQATLGAMSAPFFKNGNLGADHYQAVLAIPFNQPEGPLSVRIVAADDRRILQELPLHVVRPQAKVERIRVNRKFTTRKRRRNRSARNPAMASESFYQQVTPRKFWNGPFRLPVDSHVTSPFGAARTYNGKMKGFHAGVDLHAAAGTPVKTAAPGLVVLSRRLFDTGNTVVIDHGYGVFTLYAHLNKLMVEAGETLGNESVIGLSGNTGRVKGAHLHWAALVQGVRVNSADLLTLMN